MSQPDLIHIKLSQLGISKLNMRHGRKAQPVSPSMRGTGLERYSTGGKLRLCQREKQDANLSSVRK